MGWRQGYRRPLGPTADLAPKLGRPGVWLSREDLARIRLWAELWKRRSGL